MRSSHGMLQVLWSRYKKKILIIGVTVMALFMLLLGGIGYALYQSAVFAKETIQSYQGEAGQGTDVLGQIPPEVKEAWPDRGWVEGFVVSLGSLWLQEGLAEQSTAQVKSGLACLDSMGGPNPLEMVDRVKSRIQDERVVHELDTLMQDLRKSVPENPGPAACASWILSG